MDLLIESVVDAIRSALDASNQPDAPDLNWVADSPLAHLSVGIGVERVYSIAVADALSEKGSLVMQLRDNPGTHGHRADVVICLQGKE